VLLGQLGQDVPNVEGDVGRAGWPGHPVEGIGDPQRPTPPSEPSDTPDEDPHQPGLDRRASLEGPQAAEGAGKRLLHRVFGVGGVAEHGRRHRVKPPAVPLHELRERVVVAAANSPDQLGVGTAIFGLVQRQGS